jgi:hypothetical protein
MSSNCSIKLHDRVKQLSTTEGTGNMALQSSVDGFLNFSNVYSHQDTVFYGISDGTNFEIGSGIFLRADFDGSDSITVDQIKRNVFTSSATNSGIVNFPSGTKEVFVTYAATHAVFHGSGINSFSAPENSGIVFWGCDNILDYDSNFIWDKNNKYIGIRKSSPTHGIELGGDGTAQSMIKASGFVVGTTGIHFPSGNGLDSSYSGGIQYKHFIPNSLAEVNVSSVLELSGAVKEVIWFKKQSSAQVFAGPSSGLADGYPNFRSLNINDTPFVTTLSGVLGTRILNSGNSLMSDVINVSGNLNTSNSSVISSLETASGLLNSGISITSGVITSNVIRNPLTNNLHLGGHALSGIGSVNIVGSGAFSNNLHVSGNIFTNGGATSRVGVGTTSPSGLLHLRGEYSDGPHITIEDTSSTLKTQLYNGNTISVITVDPENSIASSALTLQVDGSTKANFSSTATTFDQNVTINASTNKAIVGNSVSVFNEDGANVDFRVEGDTDEYLIFADASADSVGFGASSVSANVKVTVTENSDLATHTPSGAKRGIFIDQDNTLTANDNTGGPSRVGGVDGSTTKYSIGMSVDNRLDVSSGVRNSGYVMGIDSIGVVNNSGYVQNSYGLRTYAGGGSEFHASGYIANAISLYSRVLNLASGTVHNAMGLYSTISAGSNGKIGNAYGIYLYPNAGTITSGNYGIYQQGSEDNFFNGTLDTASSGIRIRDDHTPASASADGFKGQIVWDANYIYICTATNTWKRAALSTW